MQDLRYSVRLWRRRPWHAALAVSALAIGMGANVGVFSVVNALLLRSLPFREPERLAYLSNFAPPHDSAAQFHAWRSRSAYLDDTALFETFEANLGGAGEPRRARVAQTSWNFFSVLGGQPVLGRAFVAGEDMDGTGWGPGGANAVALIGYDLWQTMFGGDPRALGSTIRVDGRPLVVIGVAPPGFDYPNHAVLWKPAAYSPGNNGWEVIGRLHRTVTWPQARDAFASEAARLWPDKTTEQQIRFPSQIIPLRDALAGPAKNASLVLMGCVALILLIAWANVANLLIARMADRAAEFSVRSALGASRWRLLRQMLTECALLSMAGAAGSAFVALWTVSAVSKIAPTPLGASAYSVLDGRVWAFATAVCLAGALVFGSATAFYAGRVHGLGTRGSGGDRGWRWIRELLVTFQVALSILLLAASVSVNRALADLSRMDRGFEREGLIAVNVSLEGSTHVSEGGRLAYFGEALRRIRQVPGVVSASATEFLPLDTTDFIGGVFSMDGRAAPESSTVIPVMSDYFGTMGGRILWGREFTDAESEHGAPAAVVTERFAMQFGAASNAVGRHIAIGNGPPRRVVGVVKGMDYMRERRSAAAGFSQVFVPSRSPGGFFSAFVARVNGRAENHVSLIRDAIRSVDPQVPLYGVKTMEQRLSDALARERFYRTAVSCFTGFAILLAVIGTYGMVSYSVAQRTREMGVRVALGATPFRLRVALLRRGLSMMAAGLVPGVLGAMAGTRLLASLVEGARGLPPAGYALAALCVAAAGAAAIWTGTRRLGSLSVTEVLAAE